MKIYRYNKKQYIQLSKIELETMKNDLIKASKKGHWGEMRSPIDGLPLDLNKLNYNCCIGCAWLNVFIYTNKAIYENIKMGFNTYLKPIKRKS